MKINNLPQLILVLLLLILQEKTFAQMGINATGTPPANNAMLDISSTTKGLLIPRMTTVQRNALAHTQGLTVFDVTTNGYWYSDGDSWINMAITTANPWLITGNNISNTNTGNIGIGTNTPKAFLNIPAGKTVLFGTDSSGFGNKFIWYGNKGALRVGFATINEFDYGNVGIGSFSTGTGNSASGAYSTAMGSHNLASGAASVSLGAFSISSGNYSFSVGGLANATGANSIAIGQATTASASLSVAMGDHSVASGPNSTSIGYFNIASGTNSVAIGHSTTASANLSFAMGDNSTASGINATAIGYYNTASGNGSTAFGNQTEASGNNSTAMGRFANTNNHTNSFCIGGASNNFVATSTADNQMMMRFDNYTFFVAGTNNYAYIIPSSNGWAYTSDRNRKENFEELNGESVLKKIAKIPFYSWNFKDKTVKQYRHYGIMAQDFHDNFGKDKLGVIGNDTTVSALDLLGVAYSGIKALEKRTEELQNQNEILMAGMNELKALILPKRKKYTIKKAHTAKKEELFTLK